MRANSRWWSAVLATGLVAAGCRARPETATASPTTGPAAAKAPAHKPARPPSVAQAQSPIDLLPERTALVVSAASVRHLLRVVDVPALISTYRPFYGQASAYVEQMLGVNLLDPGRWPEIGLDPDQPLGFALLDADSGASCYFFSLTDPPRFRDFVDRAGSKLGGAVQPVFERREREMRRALLGPMGPLGLGLSLGPEAIAGTARAQVPEKALLRRAVQPGAPPPLAITAASERVLFGTAAKLDVKEGLAALDVMLRVDGQSVDELFAALQRELGGEPRAAVELLDGAVSFALTAANVPALPHSGAKAEFGFNLALGLKNPTATAMLVAATMTKIQSSSRGRAGLKVKRGKGGGHVVSVPRWRDVHVALVGSTLTLSTDPKFAPQVERGAARKWEPRVAQVGPIVTSAGAAATLMLDHALPLGIFMGRAGDEGERWDPSRSQPYWRFPSVAQGSLKKVPQSSTYKARLKEWLRLDAKIAKVEAAQQRRRREMTLAAADSLGMMAVNLRETAEGLEAEGGQFFGPGGLTRTIERMIEGLATTETDYSLHEERGRIEQEMQEIRIRDLERALGVRAGE